MYWAGYRFQDGSGAEIDPTAFGGQYQTEILSYEQDTKFEEGDNYPVIVSMTITRVIYAKRR